MPSLGFMSLPRELRDMIYKLALDLGTIYVPWQDYDGKSVKRDGGKPIGLIWGVNKAIQAEAPPFFYRQNRFVFESSSYQISWENLHLIRDACIPFHYADEGPRMEEAYEFPAEDEDGNPITDENQYQLLVHNEMIYSVQDTWESRVNFLGHVEHLEIDLTQCYCTSGCCRLVEDILGRLGRRYRWDRNAPRTIKFTGFEDYEEGIVEDWINRYYEMYPQVKEEDEDEEEEEADEEDEEDEEDEKDEEDEDDQEEA
ncbi:hypothetical protein GGR54DRAFT_650162 [Hypoxylon sp. NC1633]|nr:hypothetical protein GGR54DRAFT_650162 [Hypoxylon sp. NC1633]